MHQVINLRIIYLGTLRAHLFFHSLLVRDEIMLHPPAAKLTNLYLYVYNDVNFFTRLLHVLRVSRTPCNTIKNFINCREQEDFVLSDTRIQSNF